jgi:hypothetical protein
VLGGVEVLDACLGDAVLAPELVSLGLYWAWLSVTMFPQLPQRTMKTFRIL